MSLPPGWKSKPGEQINVKARISGDKGDEYLALALTEENIAYLKAPGTKVIGVDLRDLGYPGTPHKVIIVYGETDEKAREALPKQVKQIDLTKIGSKA